MTNNLHNFAQDINNHSRWSQGERFTFDMKQMNKYHTTESEIYNSRRIYEIQSFFRNKSRTLPHEMNLTAQHKGVMMTLILHTQKVPVWTNFHSMGHTRTGRMVYIRGERSALILHKFHIKPSLRSEAPTVGSLLFSTLYHNRELLCVCFLSFEGFGVFLAEIHSLFHYVGPFK